MQCDKKIKGRISNIESFFETVSYFINAPCRTAKPSIVQKIPQNQPRTPFNITTFSETLIYPMARSIS